MDHVNKDEIMSANIPDTNMTVVLDKRQVSVKNARFRKIYEVRRGGKLAWRHKALGPIHEG